MVARLLLDQVGQDLAVGGRLKQAALVFEVAAQQLRIDDIAVMRQREVARVVAEEERLDILHAAASGRGVTHMADGRGTFQRGEFRLVENLRHQPSALDAAERAALVHRDDAGPLLPAVLQGVETVIGQRRGVRHSVDAEHPALLVQFTVADHFHHTTRRFFAGAPESPRKPRGPCPGRGGNGPCRVSRWSWHPTDGRCRATPRRPARSRRPTSCRTRS